MRSILTLLAVILLRPDSGVWAAHFAADQDLSRQVQITLKTHCFQCHGPSQQLSGLRLDTRKGALEGGYSGTVIVPGASTKSSLIQRLTSDQESSRMPLGSPPLPAAQIETLRNWIEQGAPWPEELDRQSTENKSAPEHWSFLPVVRPVSPAVQNRSWSRTPIDLFTLSRLESEGFTPSPMASKLTLIRRVSLDLTGLLPTVEEVKAFQLDNRPDAYEHLVERLLGSSHYGEKWARHWLDLARYADSDGYEKDLIRPHAWRWRQWVIQALNQDLPYDRFTIEQIAGDLLPQRSTEQIVATGFLRNGLTNREGGVLRSLVRFEETVDQTNTIGSVWLGLTLGCAQCHDHKYDPLSQKEYYQFMAFFNQARGREMDAPLPGEMGPYIKELPAYLKKRKELLENTEISVPRLQARWEAKLLDALDYPGKYLDWDDILRGAILQQLDQAPNLLRIGPSRRTRRENDLVTHFFFKLPGPENAKNDALTKKLDNLKQELEALETAFPDVTRAYVVESITAKTHIALRGDYRSPGVEVQPDTPDWLPPLDTGKEPPRLRLARWLVDKDNPLTARVAVNRLWQELFGRGLVTTSEDFGSQGSKPSNQALLDWLAAEFIHQRWSQKELLRIMVTSATYQQSSRTRHQMEHRDPENVLLGRQSRLRLSAELIRDAALKASGLLDTQIGGKSVRPPQPQWVSQLTYGKSDGWEESLGQDRYRRGLYVLFKRSAPYPQMINFDAPDASISVCRRERTNTPLQALNLLNDPVFMESARSLALRTLTESSPTWSERLDHVYRLCLARVPSHDERKRFRDFFVRQKDILQQEPDSVQKITSGTTLDFEPLLVATWTMAGRAIMNLDEFITRE